MMRIPFGTHLTNLEPSATSLFGEKRRESVRAQRDTDAYTHTRIGHICEGYSHGMGTNGFQLEVP